MSLQIEKLECNSKVQTKRKLVFFNNRETKVDPYNREAKEDPKPYDRRLKFKKSSKMTLRLLS